MDNDVVTAAAAAAVGAVRWMGGRGLARRWSKEEQVRSDSVVGVRVQIPGWWDPRRDFGILQLSVW